MLFFSNVNDGEDKPMRKSSFILKDILFIGLCIILLITMIIVLSIMKNLPFEFLFLIILNIIAIIFVLIIYIIKVWNKLKKNSIQIIEMPKQTNPLRRIINVTSISLSIFTILFSASIMMSLNFGYSSFGTFILFSIRISTIIWFFTLQIYLLMICVKCIWKKSSFYRQQLSSGIISFFLSNFLICTYFMFGNAIPSGSILIGLGLGFGLPLSFCLVISGIIAMIVYQSKKLKLFFSFLSLIGCIGFLFILWFYLINGYDMKINVIIPLERYPDNLTNDPSLNGNYSYKCLTYGSGYDHRIDYESKVTIQTPTIDLSSLIRISSFNKRYFQFNESNLPLNGRIWYPITHTNRYPIVLMVHGNHLSTESSEYGYDYLCQMLASQGFFCLSIDENYLNSGLFTSTMEYGRISSIKKYLLTADYAPEYLARAIILLETLKQIRLWNKNSTNPFYQKLDLTNIALMGHSRGGQAIVIAYLLNKLKYLPEYPSDILLNNYHFSIKGLFSIGGADDGYMPLGRSLTLSNINLFAIHGIYDGDVVEFSFQSTMTNLKFTSRQNEYYFKSSLYVHQANHGQFNSDWGKYDHSPGTNKYLNIRPLLPMNKQQSICQIYMSAFMNLVLKNQTKYKILFEDYRSGLNYLPYTNYISTFQDSNEIILNDFENYDITKGTIKGSNINGTNLLLWSSVYMTIYRSAMLLLQPKENLTGKYRINLEKPLHGSKLRFMIGRTAEGLIDYLIVRVFYQNGIDQSFNVRVLPPLTKQLYKISLEVYVIALQTITLSLLYPVHSLEFIVNGTNAQFLIDNIVIVK